VGIEPDEAGGALGRPDPKDEIGPLGGAGLARDGITLGEGGAGGMGLGGAMAAGDAEEENAACRARLEAPSSGGRLSSTTGKDGSGIVSSSPTSVSSSTSVWKGSLFLTTARGKGSSSDRGSEAGSGWARASRMAWSMNAGFGRESRAPSDTGSMETGVASTEIGSASTETGAGCTERGTAERGTASIDGGNGEERTRVCGGVRSGGPGGSGGK